MFFRDNVASAGFKIMRLSGRVMLRVIVKFYRVVFTTNLFTIMST